VKTSSAHHPSALCFPGAVMGRREIKNKAVTAPSGSPKLEQVVLGDLTRCRRPAINLNKVMPDAGDRGAPRSAAAHPYYPALRAALLHLSCWPIWSGDERLGFNSGFVCLLCCFPPSTSPLSPFSAASLPSPTLRGGCRGWLRAPAR